MQLLSQGIFVRFEESGKLRKNDLTTPRSLWTHFVRGDARVPRKGIAKCASTGPQTSLAEQAYIYTLKHACPPRFDRLLSEG